MESSELRRKKIKQNRRKERAEKVAKERAENDGDDDNAGPPVKKPRRKPKKLIVEEDIVDGFAILAFKNYEDLTRSIKSAEEDKNHKKSSDEVLKRSQEGVDNKILDKHKKIKKPKPNTVHNQPLKISDGCSDLFAPSRKDSSPTLLDNLHSCSEDRGVEPPRHQICELNTSVPTSSVFSLAEAKTTSNKFETPELTSTKPLHKNGKLSSDKRSEELNGHVPSSSPQNAGFISTLSERGGFPPQKSSGPQTLFTPYAATAITRVVSPNYSAVHPLGASGSFTESPSPTPPSFVSTSYARPNSGSAPSSSGSLSQSELLPSVALKHARPVIVEKCSSKHARSSSPFTPGGSTVSVSTSSSRTDTPPHKSNAFGSIARLLDTPSVTRCSPVISSASTTIFSHNSQSAGCFIPNGSGAPNIQHGPAPPVTCSSRSHSPRGHSPSRERDSYSSNVSSLSRTSGTPVNNAPQLPPTISPLQNLQSYSKAASWLNTVRGISPVPRPAPPTPSLSMGSAAATTALQSGIPASHLAAASPVPVSGATVQANRISSLGTPTSRPHNLFPGLPQSPSHHNSSIPSTPNSASSAMFAAPMLPLSSITAHSPAQFGSSDTLFSGSSASSELVRRDLESRVFMPPDRGLGASPTAYMGRISDLHHHLLPPLPGLSSNNSVGQPTSSHSAIYSSSLMKDMPKVTVDGFYRPNIAMNYAGYNGFLPLGNTPFAPPSQIAAFTPKVADPCKTSRLTKTGKWNAMHVRIAWEIYNEQQKGRNPDAKIRNSPTTAPRIAFGNSSCTTGTSAPQPSPVGHNTTADLMRPAQQVYGGLVRTSEMGNVANNFPTSMLSTHPGTSSALRPHFDSALFLNPAASLGQAMPRYPGFSSLGPAYGGIGSLSSSLLNRDLSNIGAVGSHQDHWQRNQRGPPFPAISPLSTGWPMQAPLRSDKDNKISVDSRKSKDDRLDKKLDLPTDIGRRSAELSPFRDRSPVRMSRTPLENGDVDSRSSRSSESHATVHAPGKPIFRPRDESNGDLDREKLMQQLQNDSKQLAAVAASHNSRLYHPNSPMTVPTSVWDSFSQLGGSSTRVQSADSFRLNILPLSERERDLHRFQYSAVRPPLYNNGPFGNLPIGLAHASSSSITKANLGTPMPMPLLNPTISAVAAHNHLLHSSLNGPNSPKIDSLGTLSARPKEESQSR